MEFVFGRTTILVTVFTSKAKYMAACAVAALVYFLSWIAYSLTLPPCAAYAPDCRTYYSSQATGLYVILLLGEIAIILAFFFFFRLTHGKKIAPTLAPGAQ